MNVIFVMIDSLNRTYLSPYGNDWIKTPNFDRLASRALTIEKHWTGSLPTMPTRHEIFAGRYEYPWRGWGPLEPYDKTIPSLCRDAGIPSMFITDTYHYFQAGSGNYHMDFLGWEFLRGHETDNWITDPTDPPALYRRMLEEKGEAGAAYMRNTVGFKEEKDFFSPRLFSHAADWLERNHTLEHFLLMVDSFDVHEPFHVPPPYDTMYDPEFTGEWSIWNEYADNETFDPAVLKHIQAQYAGKVTMMDTWFGTVLDKMDTYNLWDTTALIVTSDHGHHLGEHGYVGKNRHPYYRHLTNVPLFIWMPGMAREAGTRGDTLSTQVDLYPTLVDLLELTIPDGYETHGQSMTPYLMGRTNRVREYAHTSYFGNPIAVTDGRWVLHKYPAEETNLYKYGILLEPYHMRSESPYVGAETGTFLPYTDAIVFKSLAVQHVEPRMVTETDSGATPDILFDLERGERDEDNLIAEHPAEAERLSSALACCLQRIRAPEELFTRMGLG